MPLMLLEPRACSMCPLEGVSSGKSSLLRSSSWNSCFASDSDRNRGQHLPSTPRSLWGRVCHPLPGVPAVLGRPYQALEGPHPGCQAGPSPELRRTPGGEAGPPEHPPQPGALRAGPGTRECLSWVCPRVCQVSQVSMRVKRGRVSWLSSHGRGIATQHILKHSRPNAKFSWSVLGPRGSRGHRCGCTRACAHTRVPAGLRPLLPACWRGDGDLITASAKAP